MLQTADEMGEPVPATGLAPKMAVALDLGAIAARVVVDGPLAARVLERGMLARDGGVEDRDIDLRVAAELAAVSDRVSTAPRIDDRGSAGLDA